MLFIKRKEEKNIFKDINKKFNVSVKLLWKLLLNRISFISGFKLKDVIRKYQTNMPKWYVKIKVKENNCALV